jgi:UDP-2-acetamido-2-deoxy-ribo-hexuluronate aminotransferase
MRRRSPNRVDFLGLNGAYARHRTEVLEAVDRAMAGGQPMGGPLVAELERRCADQLGRTYVAAVGSGTDALTIALLACGIGPDDEVIVTAFSFIASASPILLVGATPVYVDIAAGDYLMETAGLPSSISRATKALVAVQLFGRCLVAEEVERFAEQHGLIVIEDAAQAFGASRGRRAAGRLGRVTALSFDPTKVLGGITSGGLVATDDREVHEAVLRLRAHGFDRSSSSFVRLGYNSRMSDVNAAVLLHHIGHQAEWRTDRARIAQSYRRELADLDTITLPPVAPRDAIDNHHKFVIRTRWRDALRSHLTACGVETRIHYARALPDHPALQVRGRLPRAISDARMAAQEVLSLPVHPGMTEEDVCQVVEAILSFPTDGRVTPRAN